MNFTDFNALSRHQVSDLVRQIGPVAGVFALNGTRRWFQLEHGHHGQAVGQLYFEAITTRLIELTALMFDYGIDTLLVPLLSPHLFDTRGSKYTEQTVGALTYLTRTKKFIDFYTKYDVAARFYGDYSDYLQATGHDALLAEMNRFNASAPNPAQHRLYWGVCAHDSVSTTAKLAINFYKEKGRIPNNKELIKRYYGEELPEVNFFIGSSKPRAFDTPLLLNGREDLYFTVAPSPYLNEQQLREILYDHLYARRKEHSQYHDMSAEDWSQLKTYYQKNAMQTLGVGDRQHDWGLWHPTNQLNQSAKDIRG